MKKLIATAISLVVFAAAIGGGLFAFGNSSAEAKEGPQNFVVVLRGTANSVVPGGTVHCFTVDLVDPATGRVIGDGTDCLDLASNVDIGDDGGFEVTNITTFNLPGGTLVVESRSTVQPSGPGSPGITHITGALPAAGTNQITSGTGRFQDAEGRVTINGAVDLSGFGGVAGDPVTFDCIFVIDLN